MKYVLFYFVCVMAVLLSGCGQVTGSDAQSAVGLCNAVSANLVEVRHNITFVGVGKYTLVAKCDGDLTIEVILKND